MKNFVELDNNEMLNIDGGVCLVGGFSLGYGLASWLG